MRVGLDQFTLHPFKNWDPFFAIQWAHEHGLEGVQFGGIRGLSPTLDLGRLREIQGECDRLGMYCLASVSSPNPHAGKGGGSIDQVVEQLGPEIQAAAAMGWGELHSSLGGLEERAGKPVAWPMQLAASLEALAALAPMLKAAGCRINLENHGDATTFELVRLCQQVGPQTLGICLDTANMLCHGEDPLEAARRAAPYVHQTHAKDAIIYLTPHGYTRQGRPPGEGVVPWPQVLAALGAFSPDLCLSIEDHKWIWEFAVFEPAFHAMHPDLTPAEMGKVVGQAWGVTQRIQAGELPDPAEYEKIPFIEQVGGRVCSGRQHLNKVVAERWPSHKVS